MKKSFILLALTAYFVIGAYSVTRTKSSTLPSNKVQSTDNSTAMAIRSDFKLVTNQPEAIMKFYQEAFGTDWQAGQDGYQGQVLNTMVQVVTAKNKKQQRRTTLRLETYDFDGLIQRILDAGGSLQARVNGKTKDYTVNDPDGNLIVLTRRTP